jgi:hypothetical protein
VMVPETKKKPGPRPTLSGDLAFWTAFALGRGLDVREIAAAAGVSSSTALRFATHGQLTSDPRCEELKRLVYEQENRSGEPHVQDRLGGDPCIDAY